MELNPVTIMSLNGTRNGPFGGDSHDESPRKNTRNLPRRTEEAGETLTGHGSAHFYTGVPPVSSRALRGSLSDRIRMRQTGRRGRCFRCSSPASFPPSKGCGPCAASRLSQVDGRRPPIRGPATRPTALRASCLINGTNEARTTKKQQRRRKPTMKKTRDELQNELAEAQRQYDQEQHRQQRLQNRKEYF